MVYKTTMHWVINLQRTEIYSGQPKGQAVQDHAPNGNWQGPSSCTLTWWEAEEQAGWLDAAGVHAGGASQPGRPLMTRLFSLSHRNHSDVGVSEGTRSKQSNSLSSINFTPKASLSVAIFVPQFDFRRAIYIESSLKPL